MKSNVIINQNECTISLKKYYSYSMSDHLLKKLKIKSHNTSGGSQPISGDNLEVTTRGRSDNPKTKEERLLRPTSSHGGRICKANGRTDMDCLAATYVQPSRINAPSLKHGHTSEKVVNMNGVWTETFTCVVFL